MKAGRGVVNFFGNDIEDDRLPEHWAVQSRRILPTFQKYLHISSISNALISLMVKAVSMFQGRDMAQAVSHCSGKPSIRGLGNLSVFMEKTATNLL